MYWVIGRNVVCSILVFALLTCVKAQEWKVNVDNISLLDSISGEYVSSAIVQLQLYREIDSTFQTLKFTRSDNLGKFTLDLTIDVDTTAQYFIRISHISYQTKYIRLPIAELEYIYLSPRALIVDEVVIESRRPIYQHGDTISYDANSFRDSTERKLKDILEKLPGIDVTEDGKVSFMGRQIEKVLIEGDDLSGNDYTLITRSLPADMVDKVQLIQRYSENRLRKDFAESNRLALNITIPEDKKNSLITSLDIGLGSDSRFDLKWFLVAIYQKAKVLSNIGYNTVGITRALQVFSNTPSFSHPNNLGNLLSIPQGRQPFQHNTINTPLQIISNNFNNTGDANIRYVSSIKPRAKLELTVNYVIEANNKWESKDWQFRTDDSTILQFERQEIYLKANNLEVGAKYFNELSPSANLEVFSQFNSQISSPRTSLISTVNDFNFQSNEYAIMHHHFVGYNKKIGDKLLWEINTNVYMDNQTKRTIKKHNLD